jgi:hypothetical protein
MLSWTDEEIIKAAQQVCGSEYPDDYEQVIQSFKEMFELLPEAVPPGEST